MQSASSSAEPVSSAASLVLADCPVLYDADAGDVCLDISKGELNDLGFTFGDSVDVEFSNGYKLEGIPYYDDYYTEVGGPLLVAYHE